ncbi:MAG: hypothetical protein E7580_07685 [Ruminococcaceae bacterium]|nr:hypothetical protein [Oscillospiraceae bacterium]
MINPIRYRGYYYDIETCRFINADILLDTASVLGFNLFAYCGNNPVNRADPSQPV